MKRTLALLLAISLLMGLLLCGCKKKKPPVTEPTVTTQETTQETTQATIPETKPKEVLYRHPLTGAPLDTQWNGQIVAVMMNNLKKAMPQKGVGSADILYEIEVEGDITRCLAVFSDLSKVDDIGPIRSARTAFNSVAVSFDAPLIHCGGSPGLALAGRYGGTTDTIANWEHIDQGSNGKYFYRDTERYNSGYAYEHTLFTTGEKLQQAVNDKGYNTPTESTYGLQFKDGATVSGEKAEEITVKFKSGKSTILTYNATTGKYNLNMHGTEHIDGNTGEAVTFKNVIAIYTKQWYHSDGMHKLYDTIGSGEGYAAMNGQIVPIKWSRESLRSPYVYTLADGTPLTLDVGTSYIALVGIKNPISYK